MILDSSALLAIVFQEPGFVDVLEELENAEALEAFEMCIAECEGWAGPEDWPHKEALEAAEQLRKP